MRQFYHINQIPGKERKRLFIDICDIVVVGHGDGCRVEVRDITGSSRSCIDFVETDNRLSISTTDREAEGTGFSWGQNVLTVLYKTLTPFCIVSAKICR
jgi:hypothetical protein